MSDQCGGGCGRPSTQRVVVSAEEEPMNVCGYCAVTFVEAGYKIAAGD